MKTRRLLKLYFVLLLVALLVMAMFWNLKEQTTPLLPRDYPEIQAEGILRIVTEYNQAGYYVAGDTIEGFQYELSQAIAQLSGLEVQMHLEMNLAKSFEELDAQKCDVIARNIPITSNNREIYLFTDPIVLDKQVLVQRTAAANDGKQPIRNQLDLARKQLHIPKNSPALLRLRNLEHEIGDTIYTVEDEFYSSEQLAMMVAQGDIDYAVCDQQTALQSSRQMQELDVRTDISFTQLQSWAVRKEAPALRDSLNAWFARMRESGLYEKIYQRYYGKQR